MKDQTHKIFKHRRSPRISCITTSPKQSHSLSFDLPGRILNEQYRVEQQIGQGGMSHIFKASDLCSNRTVALKLLSPEDLHDRESIRRLVLEARISGLIRHPNVVRIFAMNATQEGLSYIVMEYLDGEDLKWCLQREGTLPLRHVIEIGQQVCHGLNAIHKRNVVHQDLKPGNIFMARVRDEMMVKILDFGIAKILSEHSLTSEVPALPTPIEGTPGYMSPEQILGQKIGPAADLYSLGVVLYQMIMGRLPFADRNVSAMLFRHVHQDPPDLSGRSPRGESIPKDLAVLIRALLAKQSTNRPLSAPAVADSLAEIGKSLLSGVCRQPGAGFPEKFFFSNGTDPSFHARKDFRGRSSDQRWVETADRSSQTPLVPLPHRRPSRIWSKVVFPLAVVSSLLLLKAEYPVRSIPFVRLRRATNIGCPPMRALLKRYRIACLPSGSM